MRSIIVILIISILISCGNSTNTEKNDSNSLSNTQAVSNLQLSENEKAYNYDAVYLLNDNGEYISSAVSFNDDGHFGYLYFNDTNQNSLMFDISKAGEIDQGNLSGTGFDNKGDTKTVEGNFPSISYPFIAKIDGKEYTFKAAKTPVTGARIIEYSYSNVSPENTEDERIFLFKTALFALKNDKNIESINKINLDINKDFGITDISIFNDLTKLLTAQTIISNGMTSVYNQWAEDQYMYHLENYSSKFAIDYLSEKIVSVNKFVYEYTGGAHGSYSTIYSVYSLENGNKLTIENILTDVNNADLLNLVKDKLFKIEGRDENSYFELDELTLKENNFYLTSKGLVFTWGIYSIGPYSIGETRVLIPIEEIKPYLKDEYKTIFE